MVSGWVLEQVMPATELEPGRNSRGMGGKGRISNPTYGFSVMIGVAVLCTRRILDACDDRFKRPIVRMLPGKNLKPTLLLLRKRSGEIALVAFMLGGRRPEGTLTAGYELFV